jgi:hypothetical protein
MYTRSYNADSSTRLCVRLNSVRPGPKLICSPVDKCSNYAKQQTSHTTEKAKNKPRNMKKKRKKNKCYSPYLSSENRKRPLGRSRRRCEDNIRLYVKQRRCEEVKWIRLTQDRNKWRALVNTLLKLQVPQKAGNFLTS